MVDDIARLNCTVMTYERCKVKVHLMFRDGPLETRSRRGSGYSCTDSKTFAVYQAEFRERLTSSRCIVEDNDGKHEFPFRLRPSGNV